MAFPTHRWACCHCLGVFVAAVKAKEGGRNTRSCPCMRPPSRTRSTAPTTTTTATEAAATLGCLFQEELPPRIKEKKGKEMTVFISACVPSEFYFFFRPQKCGKMPSRSPPNVPLWPNLILFPHFSLAFEDCVCGLQLQFLFAPMNYRNLLG